MASGRLRVVYVLLVVRVGVEKVCVTALEESEARCWATATPEVRKRQAIITNRIFFIGYYPPMWFIISYMGGSGINPLLLLCRVLGRRRPGFPPSFGFGC